MNEGSQRLKKLSGWGMVWGILTILFGFMAIGAPFVSGLVVGMLVGIRLVFAGITMLTLGTGGRQLATSQAE